MGSNKHKNFFLYKQAYHKLWHRVNNAALDGKLDFILLK